MGTGGKDFYLHFAYGEIHSSRGTWRKKHGRLITSTVFFIREKNESENRPAKQKRKQRNSPLEISVAGDIKPADTLFSAVSESSIKRTILMEFRLGPAAAYFNTISLELNALPERFRSTKIS